MKKILLLGAMVFVLEGGVLLGQKTEKSGYPFEIKGKVATAVFAEKTYDQVWGATIKALIASNYKTTTLEKDAGLIEAVHIKSASTRDWEDILETGKAEESSITAMVETQGDKVAVSFRWETGEKFTLRSAKSNRNRFCSALYNKMAELLYGEVEKK